MNILLLNWRDPLNPKSGGAEKLNMHILAPLLKRGDSVTWYAMRTKDLPDSSSYQGIHIIRSGNILTHYIMWPFSLWAGKFGKVDLIIDSIHGTGYLSSVFAPFTRKLVLICEVAQNIWDEMYPFPISNIGRLWERVMFRFYKNNIFWTISNSTKKDLIKFGISKKQIKVIPMGFDGVKITNINKYKEPTALFVGRLAEMKGIKDAVGAIITLNKSSKVKWKLNIIGRGNTDLEQALQDTIKQSGMEEYISLLGYVPEKEKFIEMARSWILLVPSSREGWGMIVPEANSVGTPVIGYDVSGLRDVMRAYAKENKLIRPSVTELIKAIHSISTPPLIKNKPRFGWGELYEFIKNNI